MFLLRPLLLTFGPFLLVGASYWVAYQDLSVEQAQAYLREYQSPGETGSAASPAPRDDSFQRRLPERWQASVDHWRQELPDSFQFDLAAPFLIATDLPVSQRRALQHDVVVPVTRALQRMYQFRAPNLPIPLIVCRDEAQFRQLARRWKSGVAPGYHGFYLRDRKLVALHWEAGSGALAHELTHALAHADCPALPEWFDEGLAALYEEAEFDQPGRPLAGLDNWRISIAGAALRDRRLPDLIDLSEPGAFSEGDLELNYATARTWLLFLQEQQLLKAYYQTFRRAAGTDATGLKGLAQVFPDLKQQEIEQRFRAWLSQRRPRITTNL